MGIFSFLKKDNNKPDDKCEVRVEFKSNEPAVEYDVTPIEKRIKREKPLCDGLYPHEILLLSYAPSYYTSGDNNYPGFWKYKYGISNVTTALKSLMKRGYLTTGSIEDAVSNAKLPQIKEVLKENGLKVSGKKAELVDRLINEVPEEKLAAVFTSRPYARTEIAEQLIRKYEWIPYIHSTMIEDLDIWNLTDMVLQDTSVKYRDVIWGYLNQKCLEHTKNRDYGLYRCTKFTMSEFLTEEKRVDAAFKLLCEVVIFDLNCTVNGFRIEMLHISAKYFFPYEESILKVAPGVISRIDKISKSNNWDDDTLKNNLIICFEKFSLPLRVFTNEECADIVVAELAEDKERVSSIYEAAEKRLKQKYRF